MVTLDNLMIDSIAGQLASLSQKQFTGEMEIQSSQGQKWHLYFGLGRLIWASGGIHPRRRWRRQVRFCPEINPNLIARDGDDFECWDYHLLTILVKRQKIDAEQLLAVISATVGEVLFDIFQHREIERQHLKDQPQESLQDLIGAVESNLSTGIDGFHIQWRPGVRPSKGAILPPNCVLNTNQALEQAHQAWEIWQQADLADIFPDLAPHLDSPEQLQQQTSPAVYKNLVGLIDGHRTLRDLAFLMKLDLVKLTRSLVSYIRQNLVGLQTIPDLPPPALPPVSSPGIREKRVAEDIAQKQVATPLHQAPTNNFLHRPSSAEQPLIACVDDSLQLCQSMEQILTEANYRCITIQDSITALPILLQNKPDLIFLDLIMPVANGYEICAQIRRVSTFRNTPVIILTGNDGIVDRVRAKMVGASDYLTKPINVEKVLAAIQKYIKTNFNG